jgi:hypothetical protein
MNESKAEEESPDEYTEEEKKEEDIQNQDQNHHIIDMVDVINIPNISNITNISNENEEELLDIHIDVDIDVDIGVNVEGDIENNYRASSSSSSRRRDNEEKEESPPFLFASNNPYLTSGPPMSLPPLSSLQPSQPSSAIYNPPNIFDFNNNNNTGNTTPFSAFHNLQSATFPVTGHETPSLAPPFRFSFSSSNPLLHDIFPTNINSNINLNTDLNTREPSTATTVTGSRGNGGGERRRILREAMNSLLSDILRLDLTSADSSLDSQILRIAENESMQSYSDQRFGKQDMTNTVVEEPIDSFLAWKTSFPEGDTHCPICLENFKDSDVCICLHSCHHLFHQQCFTDAFEHQHHHCAICRSPVNVSKKTKED